MQRSIPEELHAELRRLVLNGGSLRIAGTMLFVYFKRCWKIEDELAAYYVARYFHKHFLPQWEKKQAALKGGLEHEA